MDKYEKLKLTSAKRNRV